MLFLRRLFVTLALCAAAGLIVSCGPTPSYRSFMRRSQHYYAQVADACDAMLSQSSSNNVAPRKISGDDGSVPSALRKLHPLYIYASKNSVGVRIGVGRGSYWIVWHQDDSTMSLWELETNAEGTRRVLYARTKLLPQQNPLISPLDILDLHGKRPALDSNGPYR